MREREEGNSFHVLSAQINHKMGSRQLTTEVNKITVGVLCRILPYRILTFTVIALF